MNSNKTGKISSSGLFIADQNTGFASFCPKALHVCLSANSRAIYYFCVVGEKEINFIAYTLVIHRGSKCWKDPLMSSPYKEIAIREEKNIVRLQGGLVE